MDAASILAPLAAGGFATVLTLIVTGRRETRAAQAVRQAAAADRRALWYGEYLAAETALEHAAEHNQSFEDWAKAAEKYDHWRGIMMVVSTTGVREAVVKVNGVWVSLRAVPFGQAMRDDYFQRLGELRGVRDELIAAMRDDVGPDTTALG